MAFHLPAMAEPSADKAQGRLQAAVDMGHAMLRVGVRRAQACWPELEKHIRSEWEVVRREVEPVLGEVIAEVAPDSTAFDVPHEGPLGVPDSERVPPAPDQRAVVLAVDGVDPLQVLVPHDRTRSRLAQLLAATPAFRFCAMRGFVWNGDPTAVPSAYARLQRDIENAALAASRAGVPFILVSHSGGCSMVYRALATSSVLIPGDVHVWLTLGSPLAAQGEARLAWSRRVTTPAPYPPVRPACVARWLNYYTRNDKVSGPVTDATNIELPDAPGLDHVEYNYTTRLGPLTDLDI